MVEKELQQMGIEPERMRVATFGESKPLIDQETDWARAANRRVELRINGF
jgi:outer membrane protein OmpA-like peptidoglycan-associated protein